MTLSPELHAALTAWLDWAEAGAPEHRVFKRYNGLCLCVYYYAGWEVRKELERLFARRKDPTFPFGEDNYAARYFAQTQHEDPARLAWVRKVLGR